MDVLWNTKQPYLMLVDDDAHSARLLTRMPVSYTHLTLPTIYSV